MASTRSVLAFSLYISNHLRFEILFANITCESCPFHSNHPTPPPQYMTIKKIILTVLALALLIVCMYVDDGLVRIATCFAGFAILCAVYASRSDLKGRTMTMLNSRFNTDSVRDESFHESDPDCEFSLYFQTDHSIESIEDTLLAFFLSEGYTNSTSALKDNQTAVGFVTQNREQRLYVLISPCSTPELEYQVRVGPIT